MKEFELVFYKKANGDCPVSDFLESLNKVMRFKMMHQLDLLELYGNKPKGDYSKFVKDGIFELRAQTKIDITRIFYFFDKNQQIVLTNGFVKKTQRLPNSEVETAMRYRADYFARAQERDLAVDKGTDKCKETVGPKWRPQLDALVADGKIRSEHSAKAHQNTKNSLKEERGL